MAFGFARGFAAISLVPLPPAQGERGRKTAFVSDEKLSAQFGKILLLQVSGSGHTVGSVLAAEIGMVRNSQWYSNFSN